MFEIINFHFTWQVDEFFLLKVKNCILNKTNSYLIHFERVGFDANFSERKIT